MSQHRNTGMRLHNDRNERLYINAAEFNRFVVAARQAPAEQRRFALMLGFTGVRISEALNLRTQDIQLEARKITVKTLKRRDPTAIREVPIPFELVRELRVPNDPTAYLWATDTGRRVARITAYRWIKDIMHKADITGPKASPKGLRHGFGARANMARLPLQITQGLLGHASLETTAIYGTVTGPDLLHITDHMWQDI